MKKDMGFMEEPTYGGGTHAIIYRTRVPNSAAELATRFVERWGMVAGTIDGEDSAGRSKIRLATPKEMVDRAIETAELLIDSLDQKGWMMDIPAPKPATPRKKTTEGPEEIVA